MRYFYLLFAFLRFLDTPKAVRVLPERSRSATHKIVLLLSPVCGLLEESVAPEEPPVIVKVVLAVPVADTILSV